MIEVGTSRDTYEGRWCDMTVYQIATLVIAIVGLVPGYITAVVAILRYRNDKKRNDCSEK